MTIKTHKAVEAYCQTYLKKGSVPTSDGANTGACLAYYATAKEAFNSLSENQKNIFTNSSEYADMYARLQAWAIANGETFNGSSFNSNSFNMMNANSINQLQIALITLIAVSSFACLFFVVRRRKSK